MAILLDIMPFLKNAVFKNPSLNGWDGFLHYRQTFLFCRIKRSLSKRRWCRFE
jgi:hypothetical protein